MYIGLIGLKNSGKDSLVKLLQKRNPHLKIYNIKFARGIKNILEKYFNIPSNIYENPEEKEKVLNRYNLSTRDLMILIGTFFRDIDPDCWVTYIDNFLRDIEEDDKQEEKKYFIFTDVRFENEINYIKSRGGIIIDVNRHLLYKKEKNIINKWGHNFITKFIIYFLNRGLTYKSEWQYFKNKKLADFCINNFDLEFSVEELERYLRIKTTR